ncbi:MAG TPA: hypothetical protein VIY10_02010 [Solirubrobacteraceae bacterium]
MRRPAAMRDGRDLATAQPGANRAASFRPAPVATPARAVLRLQRAAGNRAVRALLRATLFDGLDAATRAQIQSATAPIVGDKIELDDFGKSTTQLPQNTTVAFGAAVPTDATFRKGLQSTAADLLQEKFSSPDVGAAHTNFRENTTVKFAFDFSQQNGANGVWQFTYVRVGTSGAHKLLIDFLGKSPAFAPSSGASGRVGKLGWSISGFSRDERDIVLEAIDLVPDRAAALAPAGLKFARLTTPVAAGGCAAAPAWATGDYCKPAKTVTMYDPWTTSSVVQFAKASDRTRAVLHEIGHAIDMNNADKHAAFNTAVTDDGGTPVSGYAANSTLESYAECFSLFIADPDLLKALRPHVHKYLTDLFAALPSSGTGSGAGSGSAVGSGSAAGSGSR